MIPLGKRPTALTVLGLAALLPLTTAARAEEPPADEKKVIEYRAFFEAKPEALASPEAEVQLLQAQLAQKLAELKILEKQLEAARERAKKPAPQTEVKPATGKPAVIVLGLDSGLIELKRDLPKPGGPAKGTLYELVPGEKGTLILRPVSPPNPGTPPPPARVEGAWKVVPATPATPPAEARAKDLEKRLDAIMKELDQLRREIRAPQPAPQPRAPGGPPGKPEEQARNVLELRLQAEESQQQLRELDKAASDAEAAVLDARLALEKVREIVRPEAPQLKEAEARLAAARDRLSKINRARLELTDRAEAARRDAGAASRQREEVLRKALEELKRAQEKTPENPSRP